MAVQILLLVLFVIGFYGIADGDDGTGFAWAFLVGGGSLAAFALIASTVVPFMRQRMINPRMQAGGIPLQRRGPEQERASVGGGAIPVGRAD
jgi:hypothetical protein